MKIEIQSLRVKLANFATDRPNMRPRHNLSIARTNQNSMPGYNGNISKNRPTWYINKSNVQNSNWNVDYNQKVERHFLEEEKTLSNRNYINKAINDYVKTRVDYAKNRADDIPNYPLSMMNNEKHENIKGEVQSINQIVDNELRNMEKQSVKNQNAQNLQSTSFTVESAYMSRSSMHFQRPVVQQAMLNSHPYNQNRSHPQIASQNILKTNCQSNMLQPQPDYHNQDDLQSYSQNENMRFRQDYNEVDQNFNSLFDSNMDSHIADYAQQLSLENNPGRLGNKNTSQNQNSDLWRFNS